LNYIKDHIETKEFSDALKHLKTTLEKVSIDLRWSLDETYKAVNKIIPFKKELEYLFKIYLTTGGFPEVINRHLKKKLSKEKEEGHIDPILAEIFVRNVLGDVSKQEKQQTFAIQILKEIINKYGTRYTFSKLAQDIESTHVTTIDYLELLEDSFILTVLHAYDFSKQEPKFKGTKKIYFQDPFIYYAIKSSLSGIDINDTIAETHENEESLSKIVEGIVTSHLQMNQEIPLMKEPRTFHWFCYDTHGREIDNLIKLNNVFTAIETKYQTQVNHKNILEIPQIQKHIILSKEDIELKKNILVIPVEIFLSLLTKSQRNL
jgi:predicted AAA+ superfamily ATPase